MAQQFFAHSLKGAPKKNWQLLEDHLRNVAARAASFAEPFGGKEWAYLAGILHDIGKYSEEFQDMLARVANEDANDDLQKGPDHSSAGAQEINKRMPEGIGRILAYCIAGHHSGLLDGKGNEACLDKRLKKEIKDFTRRPDSLLEIPRIEKPPIRFMSRKEDVGFQLQFFTRMIFSSLVDADFLDTEAFMDNKKSLLRLRDANLQVLRDKVLAEIKNISNQESRVNQLRRSVFEQCLKSSAKQPGIFSLTVPTGGGKTLSSLAFALEHAMKYRMNRVIYVIPYTSIIEQNADVFRRILGEAAVLEHHCNFEHTSDSYGAQLASENWDAPLIVTTNVQFFETLFNHRTSKCRKAHNIVNSVIIFDEAQMLPVDLLKPCLAAMQELTRNYHCSIVLSTATQPALTYREEFKCGLSNAEEIIDDPAQLYCELKRVSVVKLPAMTDDAIASQINAHRQILCVVNTRKYARQLYESIEDKKGLYHLSALMCPTHRSEIIGKIKLALKNGLPCRVISTQLIEAGVDVDFPVVFRALAGIDSIAQAAGRCNREGKIDDGGKVYVFIPEKSSPPGFLRQSAEAASSVFRRHEEILSLDAVEDYFRELYWRNQDNLDKKNILRRLAEGVGTCDFPFKTIGEDFQYIDGGTRSIIVPYNEEAKQLIRTLRILDSKVIARKLQRFSVQVYPDIIAKLGVAALEPVHGRYHVLINDHLYKDDIGLDWNDPYFRNIEGNII